MQFELFDNTQEDLSGQIALDELFTAYYECRRNKRRTVNSLAFELNFEQELIKLWREINSNTYKIDGMSTYYT